MLLLPLLDEHFTVDDAFDDLVSVLVYVCVCVCVCVCVVGRGGATGGPSPPVISERRPAGRWRSGAAVQLGCVVIKELGVFPVVTFIKSSARLLQAPLQDPNSQLRLQCFEHVQSRPQIHQRPSFFKTQNLLFQRQ
ncbi:uncharacterized protein V6R79_000603 [Siganus canaliculatus]